VKDKDIDDILTRAAGPVSEVPPELLARISGSIGSSLRPVRPLPSVRVLAGAAAGTSVIVAIIGALILGPNGIRRMATGSFIGIAAVIAVLICLAASNAVNAMIPGRRLPVRPWILVVAGTLALVGIFALVFHDHGTVRFVHQGIVCLIAGLVQAAVAGLAGGMVLHRGFAVNVVSAGITQGTLAGLAGVMMLELHCVDFQAPHTIVWHTAVVPVSGLAGAFLGWAALVRKARFR